MGLPNAVVGSLRPSPLLTWTKQNPGESDDGSPEDLSGATLTGKLLLYGQSTAQDIAGALTVIDAANGVFRWDLAAGDVAMAGSHKVEFTANFGGAQTPVKTFITNWYVSKSL